MRPGKGHGWLVMPVLSSNSRKKLLEIARESIESYFQGEPLGTLEGLSPELCQLAGCFVTLKLNKQLRGCIGTFDRTVALYDHVRQMARSAAFHDSRFSPLQKSDLKRLRIEISVLGELRKAADLSEIEIGRHGVLLRLGSRSGTLLPQVAVEQKWTREEFVMFCAREKAGFSPAECAQAELYLYEVEKFGEDDDPEG